eukprot:6214559-Prymnesium_polylepis.1
MHYCKSTGNWTPCQGGIDAGDEGDGYCAEGYRGPRCEICSGPRYTRYFDKLDVRCHECAARDVSNCGRSDEDAKANAVPVQSNSVCGSIESLCLSNGPHTR